MAFLEVWSELALQVIEYDVLSVMVLHAIFHFKFVSHTDHEL